MSWLHPFRTRRRKRATSVPFPDEWNRILARNFPMDAELPDDVRKKLRALIQIFLVEKRFEGLGGLEMSDEIRVTIAAQACLLQLNLKDTYYPRLSSILVYPSAYIATGVIRYENGMVTEGEEVRLGEAWSSGAVVLSWDDVLYGAADCSDGHNVVLHEFAHQLDMENNVTDGAPVLPRRSMYVAWARVLGREYEHLQKKVSRNHRSVMNAYGATNPAEFFAVATETFFEKPSQLRAKHPELYAQLAEFYRQDPVSYETKADRPDTHA
jgi:Mlc titration factor MtfA (ptsG expression regulator)